MSVYLGYNEVTKQYLRSLGGGGTITVSDSGGKLLPPTHEKTYELRQNRRFDIPSWSTNRFRDTFIMASAINNGC